MERVRGVRVVVVEVGVGGVAGWWGMKKEGALAMVDYGFRSAVCSSSRWVGWCTYDYSHVEYHVGHIARFRSPERVDELTELCS